jgi:alpha-beta hydrolase superfamily lysophospholipase
MQKVSPPEMISSETLKMKRMTIAYTVTCLLMVCFICPALANDDMVTRAFPSRDGLQITADIYMKHDDKKTPFIVLFHQAKWSRGEYREIAPRLNELGFNCMAVDLRSGGEVNGVTNKTAMSAKAKGKGTTYIEALPDIEVALKYARKFYSEGKLIAWGSSYSAALVLKVAGDSPGTVDGVIAFSPGEYFARLGKSPTWIAESAATIRQPVFIASAKGEQKAWSSLFKAIPSKNKASYIPEKTEGNHGSRALWKQFRDSTGYWQALESFLKKNF